MVIGFNMTFIIQHVLGLAGMPRRVYTYPDLPGWGWMNMVSTIGAFFMTAAALIFVYNLAISLFRGTPAGNNPWNAWTLEWATTSPPPHENFLEALPPVHSRRPLWDLANPDRPDPVIGTHGKIDAVTPEKNKTGVLAFILSEAGFFGVHRSSRISFAINDLPRNPVRRRKCWTSSRRASSACACLPAASRSGARSWRCTGNSIT